MADLHTEEDQKLAKMYLLILTAGLAQSPSWEKKTFQAQGFK